MHVDVIQAAGPVLVEGQVEGMLVGPHDHEDPRQDGRGAAFDRFAGLQSGQPFGQFRDRAGVEAQHHLWEREGRGGGTQWKRERRGGRTQFLPIKAAANRSQTEQPACLRGTTQGTGGTTEIPYYTGYSGYFIGY